PGLPAQAPDAELHRHRDRGGAHLGRAPRCRRIDQRAGGERRDPGDRGRCRPQSPVCRRDGAHAGGGGGAWRHLQRNSPRGRLRRGGSGGTGGLGPVTTIAVIQARTGSTRFPSKVLADLNGRPMLSHVVERVARCRSIDRVVVATSTGPSDDAVAELAVRAGASVTRGPLDDVLRRFVLAAQEHSASVVVRITADCPLVDPRLIDTLVELRVQEGADFASNVDPRTYPDGYDVEVMTRECLERLDRDSTRPDEREHVTLRVREHPDQYRSARLCLPRDLSEGRLT